MPSLALVLVAEVAAALAGVVVVALPEAEVVAALAGVVVVALPEAEVAAALAGVKAQVAVRRTSTLPPDVQTQQL